MDKTKFFPLTFKILIIATYAYIHIILYVKFLEILFTLYDYRTTR